MADFLPGNLRDRMHELMRDKGISQADLAKMAGLDPGAFSKYLNGQTQSLKTEAVVRIACGLEVSTDFLFGLTTVPDRTHYEVKELGLSVQAANNLRKGYVDPKVITRLLETPNFAILVREIELYFSGEVADAIAAENQIYEFAARKLYGRKLSRAANDVLMRRRDPSNELNNISKAFRKVLIEIKDGLRQEVEANKLSDEQLETMFDKLAVNRDGHYREPTSEEFADTVMGIVPQLKSLGWDTNRQIHQSLIMIARDFSNGKVSAVK